MTIDGKQIPDGVAAAVAEIVTLHVAERFTNTRGEGTPCKLLVAECHGDAQCPSLGGNHHTGHYDPETKTLYEYRTNGAYVVYQLPSDFLCSEREPRPNEELLRVSVTSHALSGIVGSSNRGTHTHLIEP